MVKNASKRTITSLDYQFWGKHFWLKKVELKPKKTTFKKPYVIKKPQL